MAVKNLCPSLMDIYSTTYEKNEVGSVSPVFTLKYAKKACRIVANKNDETIANGEEKENPSLYRIYSPERLDIDENDFILIESKRYDIKYVNELYKQTDHLQIDVQTYADDTDEAIYFVWEQLWKRNEVYALMEDGKMWEKE